MSGHVRKNPQRSQPLKSHHAPTQATARWAKILLLAEIALFFTLVAFTNITDFDTNYQWETLSALLGWAGAIALFRTLHASPADFAAAKRTCA